MNDHIDIEKEKKRTLVNAGIFFVIGLLLSQNLGVAIFAPLVYVSTKLYIDWNKEEE